MHLYTSAIIMTVIEQPGTPPPVGWSPLCRFTGAGGAHPCLASPAGAQEAQIQQELLRTGLERLELKALSPSAFCFHTNPVTFGAPGDFVLYKTSTVF